jgi:hypothetical protein
MEVSKILVFEERPEKINKLLILICLLCFN